MGPVNLLWPFPMPSGVAVIVFWELWKNHLAWIKIWPVFLVSSWKKRKNRGSDGISCGFMVFLAFLYICPGKLLFKGTSWSCSVDPWRLLLLDVQVTSEWAWGLQDDGHWADVRATPLIPYLMGNFKRDWGRSRGTFIGAHLWWNVRKENWGLFPWTVNSIFLL